MAVSMSRADASPGGRRRRGDGEGSVRSVARDEVSNIQQRRWCDKVVIRGYVNAICRYCHLGFSNDSTSDCSEVASQDNNEYPSSN